MISRIEQLIEQYQEKGDFLYTSPPKSLISAAEERLGVKLPEEFKWFLNKYGYGGIGGLEIFGVGKNSKCIFEDMTLKYRQYGLEKELVVIENCDEWLYCINTNNEKIVMWFADNEDVQVAYNNFLEYFLDQLNDAIENL